MSNENDTVLTLEDRLFLGFQAHGRAERWQLTSVPSMIHGAILAYDAVFGSGINNHEVTLVLGHAAIMLICYLGFMAAEGQERKFLPGWVHKMYSGAGHQAVPDLPRLNPDRIAQLNSFGRAGYRRLVESSSRKLEPANE